MVEQLLNKIKPLAGDLVDLLKHSRTAQLTLAGLVVITLAGGSLAAIKLVSDDGPVVNSACPATPSFEPVLPDGKSIKQLGGWSRLCPPDGTVSYVYQDTIDSTSISVTLQPLPKGFVGDPERHLKQLADDAHYAQQLRSEDGTVIRVGTSAKGPQSAMLIKQDLLIFIKTKATISDQSWRDYVDSLS